MTLTLFFTLSVYLPFIDRFPSIPLISSSWMLCYFVVVAAAAAAGVVGNIPTVENGMLEFCSFVRCCARCCFYLE